MSKSTINSDIMLQMLSTGAITRDTYLAAAESTGDITREAAEKVLDASLADLEEIRAKDALKGFRSEVVEQLDAALSILSIPESMTDIKVQCIYETGSWSIQKLDIKQVNGQRFINLLRKSPGNGGNGGGKSRIPLPTTFTDAGHANWAQVVQAVAVGDANLEGRSATREFGRQCGDEAKALYKEMDKRIKNLPPDADEATRQEAVDGAVSDLGYVLVGSVTA